MEVLRTQRAIFFLLFAFSPTVMRIQGFREKQSLLCGRRDCRESLLLQQLDLNFLPQTNPQELWEKEKKKKKITASLPA